MSSSSIWRLLCKKPPFPPRRALCRVGIRRCFPIYVHGFPRSPRRMLRDSMEKVTLSRFSFRSFFAIALLVVAVYVVFTQIQPAEMIKAVRDANLAMALVCVALGFIAWLGSAITLGVFMDSGQAQYDRLVLLSNGIRLHRRFHAGRCRSRVRQPSVPT